MPGWWGVLESRSIRYQPVLDGGQFVPPIKFDYMLKITQANVESMLALDVKYLENHLEPVARWGEQEPHK